MAKKESVLTEMPPDFLWKLAPLTSHRERDGHQPTHLSTSQIWNRAGADHQFNASTSARSISKLGQETLIKAQLAQGVQELVQEL